MSKKAEDAARKAYPFVTTDDCCGNAFVANETNDDIINLRSGFIRGYEQAKEDLALSWEDIKRIEDLCMNVTTLFAMVGRNKNILEQPFYEEVAKRFNEKKRNEWFRQIL